MSNDAPVHIVPYDRDWQSRFEAERKLLIDAIGPCRTLERWEQGRSKPNEQAAALIWLVRKYPDTLKRLESLAASA